MRLKVWKSKAGPEASEVFSYGCCVTDGGKACIIIAASETSTSGGKGCP